VQAEGLEALLRAETQHATREGAVVLVGSRLGLLAVLVAAPAEHRVYVALVDRQCNLLDHLLKLHLDALHVNFVSAPFHLLLDLQRNAGAKTFLRSLGRGRHAVRIALCKTLQRDDAIGYEAFRLRKRLY